MCRHELIRGFVLGFWFVVESGGGGTFASLLASVLLVLALVLTLVLTYRKRRSRDAERSDEIQ